MVYIYVYLLGYMHVFYIQGEWLLNSLGYTIYTQAYLYMYVSVYLDVYVSVNIGIYYIIIVYII